MDNAVQGNRNRGPANAAGWQACCLGEGMNDIAYDISYLLDSEPARVEAPALRVARTPPPAAPPGMVEVQAVLAQELLQAAEVHEEWIRQYLRMQGSTQISR